MTEATRGDRFRYLTFIIFRAFTFSTGGANSKVPTPQQTTEVMFSSFFTWMTWINIIITAALRLSNLNKPTLCWLYAVLSKYQRGYFVRVWSLAKHLSNLPPRDILSSRQQALINVFIAPFVFFPFLFVRIHQGWLNWNNPVVLH